MKISTLSGTMARLSLLSLVLAVAGDANATTASKKRGAKARKAVHALKKVVLDSKEAREFANFRQWKEVTDFMDQMVATHGFDRAELETTLGKVSYADNTVQLMKPPSSRRSKNWQAYRARYVEPVRINAGVAFWDQHADLLARAEAEYGVPAEIIVGIIGVETIYGRHTGNVRVMDAITTLAFAYPDTPSRLTRMAYFRRELENTLLFARESGVDPFSLLGSYAGAIGWPQFMPGSIRQFAVDFDGDHIINLRGSPADAIGSVANFLVQHGWKRGEPIIFPATVSADSYDWEKYLAQGLEAKFKRDDLKAAGVSPGVEVPAEMLFGLVDLQNSDGPTEYWLGTDNFFAITKYNRSFFYAMSVIDLGQAVKAARGR